ncbi:helix-turn-helix domain-containing protein [Mycobacterium sp.]|uniref:helix-turn-helix domain-containing protein n=1 Tax=Mycobacterium sp. TaxID=1785 RepID=UPI0031DDF042
MSTGAVPAQVSGVQAVRRCPDVSVALAAAVQRVEGIVVNADVARLLVHWLGQLADVAVQRNGCAPAGLVEVQRALAEAAVTAGDSRERESEAVPASEVLALMDEPVVSVDQAAEMLHLKPDSVRYLCRQGRLPAKRVAGRWFLSLTAVEQRERTSA